MEELVHALDDLIDLWEGKRNTVDTELEKILQEGELDGTRISATNSRRGKRESDEPLLEIYSLVDEFCDLNPRARVCFNDGLYGPLSFGSIIRREEVGGIEAEEREEMVDDWPKRLRNDLLMLDNSVGVRGLSDSDHSHPLDGSRRGSGDSDSSHFTSSSMLSTDSKGIDSALSSKERSEELLKEGRLRWIAWQRKNPSIDEHGY